MNLFWYESDEIDDFDTLARLALTFDNIVVPSACRKNPLYSDANSVEAPSQVQLIEKTSSFGTQFRSYQDYSNAVTQLGRDFGLNPEDYFGMHIHGITPEFRLNFVDITKNGLVNFINHALCNEAILLGTSDLSWFFEKATNLDKQKNLFSKVTFLVSLVGTEIALPKVHGLDLETVLFLRDKLEDQRKEYQNWIMEIMNNSWELINSDPDADEINKWIYHVKKTKIEPSFDKLQIAIERSGKVKASNILTSAAEKFPKIISSPFKVSETIIAILEIFLPNLAKSIIEKKELQKAFGVGYLYALRKQMKLRN